MMSKILIVDDEADIRLLARFVLSPLGYEIVEAGSGEECLALLKDEKPDLILLDIRMPDEDGFAVLQHIRADESLSDTPVIMMSAHSSPETLEQAIVQGSQDYVVKPFKERELLQAVSDALSDSD